MRRLVPGNRRVDEQAPGLDPARQRECLTNSIHFQDRCPGQTPDPVVTVHDHRRTRRRLDFGDPLGQFSQRDECAVRQLGGRVFPGFADVQQVDGLAGRQLDFAAMHRYVVERLALRDPSD